MTPRKLYILQEVHKRGLQFLLRGQDRKDYLEWLKSNESKSNSTCQLQEQSSHL